MNLATLNDALPAQAEQFFNQCCSSPRWTQKMVKARPFSDLTNLLSTGFKLWQQTTEQDKLDAFAGHPMIGDLSSLKAKFAHTEKLAANEQQSTATADDEVLEALHALNHQYLAQFGFIFIICATGLSAKFMLSELQARIHNTRDTELRIAAEQQWNITELRLQKALQNAQR